MYSVADIVQAHQEAQSLLADIDFACSHDPDWITATQAKDLLGVSRQFVQDLVKRGVLFGVSGTTNWVFKPSVDDRIKYIQQYGKPTRGGARKKGQSKDQAYLLKHFPELCVLVETDKERSNK